MIYISTLSKRGESHPDWNEDNFYYKHTESYVLGGVFDGCSSGRDSFFASKLFANVLKSTIEASQDGLTFQTFPMLIYSFVKRLSGAIAAIGLDVEEYLSTAVFFLYDINTQSLFVKFFGDGIAFAHILNGELQRFNNDEDNQPDYLAYSVAGLVRQNAFMKYWNRKPEFRTITRDFSVSTDGLFTFKKLNDNVVDLDVERYLVSDPFLFQNPASLKRKLNIIKNKGYVHDDDVTIIRVVNDNSL